MREIHDARKHQLDEIGPLGLGFRHQLPVLRQIVVAPANESAVTSFPMDGEDGAAVVDAVLGSQLPGPAADAEFVAAVPQKGDAQFPIPGQSCMDGFVIHSLPVAAQRRLVIIPVQCQVDVTVSQHVRCLLF